MRRMIALLTALLLLFSLVGCSDEDEEYSGGGTQQTGTQSEEDGLSIRVEQKSGKMSINRPEPGGSGTSAADDTWTVFVYLCGSDLESRFFGGGSATKDLQEMCDAAGSDHVRFVVQTGGASAWRHEDVSPDVSQRFVVEQGVMTECSRQAYAGMGRSATLTDFLRWGIETYPAGHMGLVFWDHGGGSITGVCFDEQDNDDALTLREIDTALLSVLEDLPRRFDFIGFDACLMGTVETANILASYGDYMVASEESEPGSGWDYTAIGTYLAQHPSSDGAAVGKVICDSYRAACEAEDDGSIVTLSVVDLRRLDPFLEAFNDFAKRVYDNSADTAVYAAMERGIRSAENFGGNNKAEGYTNMVDLGGLITACRKETEGSEAASAALSDAVCYQVRGNDHPGASGLSMYYPLQVQGSQELSIFSQVCISPYYLSFIDRRSHGSVSVEQAEEYDDDTWFEGGFWNWLNDYLFDEDSGAYSVQEDEEDSYWSFLDGEDSDEQSSLITFSQQPGLDEYGTYSAVLSPEGLDYTADVYAMVCQLSEDGEDVIELGETYDVRVDWDAGVVEDQFDGCWLSLPDGQNLAIYLVSTGGDELVYSAPILLNGEETNLRIRIDEDGEAVVDGVCDGVDENGAADRNLDRLQDGDQIVPVYPAMLGDELEDGKYEGEAYTVRGELEVAYDAMYNGSYLYAFCFQDIYGGDYLTDFVLFEVEEDGSISYSELN